MDAKSNEPPPLLASTPKQSSRSTDWYSEGQGCVVRIGNEYVVFKVLARKGRRARVLIEAPAGAEFETL
jgi:hypothetical protein